MTAHAIHPAAQVWPLLPDDELQALADDIAENGLIDPITTDGNGNVVDGRNRIAACELAGVEPRFMIGTFADDAEIATFVVSRNSSRRHMTTGQRAAATALNLAQAGKRSDGRWAYGSLNSQDLGNSAWREALRQAGFIFDQDPGWLEEVVSGDCSLDAAYQTVKSVQAKFATDRKKRDLLADKAPDLVKLVDDGKLTLDEGVAADHERRRKEIERDRDVRAWFGSVITYLKPPRDDDEIQAINDARLSRLIEPLEAEVVADLRRSLTNLTDLVERALA